MQRRYVFFPQNQKVIYVQAVEKTDVQKVLDGDLDDFIKAYLMSQ